MDLRTADGNSAHIQQIIGRNIPIFKQNTLHVWTCCKKRRARFQSRQEHAADSDGVHRNFQKSATNHKFQERLFMRVEEKRIKEYEARNSAFQADINRLSNVAAAKMIALMTLRLHSSSRLTWTRSRRLRFLLREWGRERMTMTTNQWTSIHRVG